MLGVLSVLLGGFVLYLMSVDPNITLSLGLSGVEGWSVGAGGASSSGPCSWTRLISMTESRDESKVTISCS